MYVKSLSAIQHGIVCFTFDDRNFSGWLNAIPLFQQYNVHATLASVNVYMAAVRYLYEVTLCRHMNWKIAPRMKMPHKLPELPNHEEIQRIFDNSPSLKYRAMFMFERDRYLSGI